MSAGESGARYTVARVRKATGDKFLVPGLPSAWGVLTLAQQEVVGRLGAVEIGRRVHGDHVYLYRDESGRRMRYMRGSPM